MHKFLVDIAYMNRGHKMSIDFLGGACNTHIKNMKCQLVFAWFVQYSHVGTKYASTMKINKNNSLKEEI
jgi:hypothetical protein